MNHYVNIMHSFEEKGKDDIPTDEELLLFSESEDEEKEVKPKTNHQKHPICKSNLSLFSVQEI